MRLAVVTDGRVTWYTGPEHAASTGPDLWRGAGHLMLARLLDPEPGDTAHPQLIATSEDTVFVYAHPDDADPALAIPVGAPIAQVEVADVDGDGRAEVVVGTDVGVGVFGVE
jgi:hypothetical protein